ncbi:MAG: phenylalanine--tRNA ligase subunit beta [bacterium]|jgi:phenylalanyl-tRNA synthetase beta chain|nr:MAG: phenylalanine--tRNA ligase subunit beta [bacterium]
MNISYRWLRDLAPGLEDTPEGIAARLATYGAPVDAVVPLGAGLEDIVVARVESVRKHPNADRLSLCEVEAGGGRLQVVCGAPNVRAGAYYPFAPVGAALPGGVRIKKAKIRGEVSEGMLCSERELGLGRDHSGLLELHGTYTPGEPFRVAAGLDDVRLEVDVTPNRPDLLSHIGVARELAPGGVAGIRLGPLPGLEGPGLFEDVVFERVAEEGRAGGVAVAIEDPRGCLRYIGAVIRGVKVGPSPAWLAARLRAVGLRPVNNVVDATNYVLYELGQPLHAFDLDRLAGPRIVARRAAAGETIVTLDGQRRVLHEDMVVIADAERPVAVAGVMGGEDSEVTESTTNVFLECALFDPKAIRRARRALGLSTDASFRYERGVDPDGLERAARRALALIVAVAGGTVERDAVDIYPEPRAPLVVSVRPERVSLVLGERFDAATVAGYLEPLGFERVGAGDGALRFEVPGYRVYDVTREIDLIEEVARRHGYEAFPSELRPFRVGNVPEAPLSVLEDRLRTLLVGRGLLESRTAAFAPEGEGDVALLLPLSSAESRLRRALVPGLLRRVEHNFARGVRHVRLFEIGTVFAPGATPGDLPIEATHLAVVVSGARTPPHWSGQAEPFDLWDLKALLTEVARALGLGPDAVRPAEDGAVERPYVPGLSFQVFDAEGRRIGGGGRIAQDAVDAPAWADPIWAFEVRLDPAMAAVSMPQFRALPTHPATERDIALLVPDDVPAARVEAVIRSAGGAYLEDVHPFDVFRGRAVPAGHRSIAFRLRFRAPDRTLRDDEADTATERILRRLKDELGIERRA